MRYLIYAVQSSGATFFTYILSQKPSSIGILDLFSGRLAPSCDNFLDTDDVFLKCTVSVSPTLEEHIASFKPHKTICLSRNDEDLRKSLSIKPYVNDGGLMEEKIQIFNNRKNDFKFDYYFNYEEIESLPEELVKPEYYSFPRSLSEIKNFNFTNTWCKEQAFKEWGLGNIHTNRGDSHSQFFKLDDVEVVKKPIQAVPSET